MSAVPFDAALPLGSTLAVTALVSALLAEVARRLAWRYGVVDLPGGRRLHQRPTPRGGGVAVALAWAASASLLGAILPGTASVAAFAAALAFAGLGLFDDLRPLPAWIRLVAQIGIVAGVAALVPPDATVLPTWTIPFGLLLGLFVVNAFNFVDGADGLVPLQALCITLGLGWLVEPGAEAASWLPSWQLRQGAFAAALLGFLPFNWPRARLFLGDVGSLLLGSVCVAAAAEPVARGALHPAAALALFAVIAVDPAWTLLRRLLRRAPILQSHLEHGYHRWLQAGVPHLRLSTGALLMNGLVALPCAWAIQRGHVHPLLGLGLVFAPLLGLAVRAGAGQPAP